MWLFLGQGGVFLLEGNHRNISPEQWRWETTQRLMAQEDKLDNLHACMENRLENVLQKIDDLDQRITPLERLRLMVFGGSVVLVAVGPLLWYILSKVVPVIEKVKP